MIANTVIRFNMNLYKILNQYIDDMGFGNLVKMIQNFANYW